MKLSEIEYGYWNKPRLPENEAIENATVLGEFDGIQIHSITKVGYTYFLILNADLTYEGYVEVQQRGTELSFTGLYVNQSSRNRGIASMLILFILRKLQKKLVINFDEIITDDSRGVFYKLLVNNKIKVSADNKLLSADTLRTLFTDISDNDTVLVIESKKKKISETCFEIRNSIVYE